MGWKKFKNRYTSWVFINISQTRELYKLTEIWLFQTQISSLRKEIFFPTRFWQSRALNGTIFRGLWRPKNEKARTFFLLSQTQTRKIGVRIPSNEVDDNIIKPNMVMGYIIKGIEKNAEGILWSLVPSGFSVLESFPSSSWTAAVSSSQDRSTAGSRPSVTVSSPEDRSTAGNRPSVAVSSFPWTIP